MDVVLPSHPNLEDFALVLTSSNDIPSSTLSGKSSTPCVTSVTTYVLSTTSVTSSSVLKLGWRIHLQRHT